MTASAHMPEDMNITQSDIENPHQLRGKIDGGAHPNQLMRDERGKPTRPMLLAARLGVLDSVKTLARAGVSCFTSNLPDEATPIHVAARNNHAHVVRYLAELDVTALSATDLNANSPLQKAVLYAHVTVVEVLIDAAVKAGDPQLCLPLEEEERDVPVLHLALQAGASAELIKRLLDAGADIEARDCEGQTALHYAAVVSARGQIELLLSAGAETNATDEDGNTPLMLAVAHGDISNTERLIAAGADIEARDKDGYTASDLAQGVNKHFGDEFQALLKAHERWQRLEDDLALISPSHSQEPVL